MVKWIAFTMYPVKDMARARKFYEGLIGLEVTHDFQGRWIEYHLENGCFAITTMAKDVKPSQDGGSIAFEVDDVDAMTEKLRAAKTPILVEPFSTPVCRNVIVQDPEGNSLVLHAKKAAS